jgi:type II secretory pathway pseudopilin PulG
MRLAVEATAAVKRHNPPAPHSNRMKGHSPSFRRMAETVATRPASGLPQTLNSQALPRQAGMTLIEMGVVLLIVVTMAGLALPRLSGSTRAAACQTTDASLAAVRDAIMGSGAAAGYYGDMGTLPANPDPAKNTQYDLHYLFSRFDKTNAKCSDPLKMDDPAQCRQHSKFNPTTQRGWRGPYLRGGLTVQTGRASDTNTPPGDLSARNFTNASYVNAAVADGDSIVADAYSNFQNPVFIAPSPIILQVPTTCPDYIDNRYCARLVSAGPDGVLNATLDNAGALNRNDDRVLFLQIPDPWHNAACD